MMKSLVITGISLKDLPRTFRIFKRGLNTSSKGNFNFDNKAASALMKSYASHQTDIAIDYNHAMVSTIDPHDSRAAGWCELSITNGELWATNVRWTADAAKFLAAGEYKYISPTFNVDSSERPCEMINIALTNIPALDDLEPLIAASRGTIKMADAEIQEAERSAVEKILSIVNEWLAVEGLPEAEATRLQAIKDLVTEIAKAEDAEDAGEEPSEEMASEEPSEEGKTDEKELEKLARLSPKLEGVILAIKERDKQISALSKRLAHFEKNEHQELVEQALKSGKLVAAQRTWALSLQTETLRSFLAVTPVRSAKKLSHEEPLPSPAEMAGKSTSEALLQKMAAGLGISVDKLKK